MKADHMLNVALLMPSAPAEFHTALVPARAGRDQAGEATLDPESLEGLRRGEAAPLAALYREHHQAVRALIRRLLRDSAAVEDLVHDTFVAAPAAFRRYRGEGSIRSFMLGVAAHQVRHYLRATQRRRSCLDRFRQERSTEVTESLRDESERRDLAARLSDALETLSFEHRVVVVLCEVEERTSAEVAAMLGIREGTVRTRLHYAKKRLRALLKEPDHA